MEEKFFEIDGVIVPYTVDEFGVAYYPTKYILEKVLLKSSLSFHKKDEFKPFIKRCVIDFTFKGTAKQECYCMSKDGWVEYSKTNKPNKNKTEDKINRLKLFYDFLGIEFKDETKEEYEYYTLKCIENLKEANDEIKDKVCVRCGRSFPNHKNFYFENNRTEGGLINVCRECKESECVNENKEHEYIYNNYGLDIYKLYIEDKMDCIKKIILNKNYMCIDLRKLLPKEEQVDLILEITKELYLSGHITNNSLGKDILRSILNVSANIIDLVSVNEIIEYCTNNECIYKPFLYPHYLRKPPTFECAKKILENYLDYNNIIIEDILTYDDYQGLMKKARCFSFLRDIDDMSILEFIVKFYNNEFAGYKFKLSSRKYYKNKDNMIFDMKYLIEKEMKIPIHKIPLYVTKYTLVQCANSLYNSLRKNGYYNDLYTWINDCYPNMFIETDFNLNPYRSNFDSLEEAQVDEQLKMRFKGVIYNPRDEVNRVEFNGCIPDWIVPTYKGCYLVEYYGLWQEKESKTSHRLQRYKKTHDKKIHIYSDLEGVGYKHLAIYPDDLKNNFENLHKKIDEILN